MKAEPYHLALSFNQILDLVKQLPSLEKQRLLTALQKTINQGKIGEEETESGKHLDKVQPAVDFDTPTDIFKEYME